MSLKADVTAKTAAWARTAGGSSNMIDMLEDRGNESSSMTREEVATTSILTGRCWMPSQTGNWARMCPHTYRKGGG